MELGLGITNLVARATVNAGELSREELEEGAKTLEAKVCEFNPRWLAIVGIEAYRNAFGHRRAAFGEQEEPIGGARVWVLPNTSGLNAHHTVETLANLFADLRNVACSGTRPPV